MHNNNWNAGTVQVHVEPPPIPLIKNNNNEKLDKDFVKIKLHMNLTSQNVYLYEFKMVLFNDGNTKELILFIRVLNITIGASGTILGGTNIQYLRNLVFGRALLQFYMLQIQVHYFRFGYIIFS